MTHYLAKPTPGPLNKEHQLSKGLVFFMPLLDQVQAVDVVTGERGTTGESAGGSLRFERWGYGPHINVIPDANVSFPNSTGKLGGLSALTFAGWANIRNTGNFGRLFISNSLTVLCDPNSIGNVLGIVVNGGAGPVDSSQVIPFTANEWFHFAFVWNGSTMTMYKNGLKVNEYSHASGITTASDTNPIYIGDTATFDRWFDGRVDGLAVWNRALTQDEVSSLYRDQWQMLRPSQAIRPTIYSLVPPDPGTTAVADLDAKPKPSSPVIQHDHPLAKGLVAEWLFAEKDGTTSRETVRGANVALSGSTFSQVKGPSGYAVNFMGGMGAADSPLSGATEATIHTRLKTLGVGSSGFDPWICSQTAYNGGFYLGHDAGPATQVFIGGTKVAGPSIDDGEWHDYVVTYRGGIDLKIFVDGMLKVSSAMAVTSIPAHTGLWFAANPTASFTLQCTIDHARIWNRALSQDEVSSLSVDPFAVDRPRNPLAAILAGLGTGTGGVVYTETASGGALLDGTSTLSQSVAETGSGGALLAGDSTLTQSYVDTASGGVVADGASTVVADYLESAVGGALLDGVSTVAASYVVQGGGGALLDGVSTVLSSYAINGSGGVLCGGTASLANTYTETASGGALCGGTSIVSVSDQCTCNTFTISASGGSLCGGTATLTDTIMRGGALVGGSSLVSLLQDCWDGFVGVWHLQEVANGTSGEYPDSTRHHLDGTGGDGIDAGTIPARSTGIKCQYSQEFAGRQKIRIPQDDIAVTQPVTVSAWVRIDPDNGAKRKAWFARGASTLADGYTWSLRLGHSFIREPQAFVRVIDDQGEVQEYRATGTNRLDVDKWYHVALVWSPGASIAVYLDGVLQSSTTVTEATLPVMHNSNAIGWHDGGESPVGNVMEMRLSPEARSAAWLKAEHDNYCGSEFYQVGSEV